MDLVSDSTGSVAILEEFLPARPPGVEVIGAGSLAFFRALLQDLTENLDPAGGPRYVPRVAVVSLK